MLKIKAKINFDIVEQFNVNPDPKFLFSDLPPAEVIYSNDKVTRKATRKDRKKFFTYVFDDPQNLAVTKKKFPELFVKEDAA